ncbi:MAG: hypothetical protein LCI00_21850 [Chloroflexi bacterium]|nr:hypothetical protein [Chloroflexota bacterium]MCC6894959.1 hypothetical protein [Anaerolineae bacterium]
MEIGMVIGWAIAAVFIGGIAFMTVRGIRHLQLRTAVYNHLKTLQQAQPDMLLFHLYPTRFALETINSKAGKTQNVMFTFSPQAIAIYPVKTPPEAIFSFAPEDVRWFGRPEAYGPGRNEIWLHVELKREWVLVKLWLGQVQMMDFVRALKPLVDPALVTAYRRRRPYIHHGPTAAQPAEQDIHGAWSLEPTVSLYLMPRYLLVLHDEAVQNLIPLDSVQQISALRRLDAPQANGLVRFQTRGEAYAFALKDYEAFATALAEAAKRTLEAPVMQKQKGKDGEWDDLDE